MAIPIDARIIMHVNIYEQHISIIIVLYSIMLYLSQIKANYYLIKSFYFL